MWIISQTLKLIKYKKQKKTQITCMNLKMLKSAESEDGGAIDLFFMMRRPSTERLP